MKKNEVVTGSRQVGNLEREYLGGTSTHVQIHYCMLVHCYHDY